LGEYIEGILKGVRENFFFDPSSPLLGELGRWKFFPKGPPRGGVLAKF